MRLSTLNPSLTQSPLADGYTHQLAMDCPSCGAPYRLVICVVLNVSAPGRAGVWGLQVPAVPFGDGWSGVTLSPSFQNHSHGRKKTCAVHFSIVDGEVRIFST
jgi:hypothetical protein